MERPVGEVKLCGTRSAAETGVKRPDGSHDPEQAATFVAEARRAFARLHG